MVIFFFFQAEDGIRDLYVTGVQTCALPIWPRVGCMPCCASSSPAVHPDDCPLNRPRNWLRSVRSDGPIGSERRQLAVDLLRSEERRVGKECRSRWWASCSIKNAISQQWGAL